MYTDSLVQELPSATHLVDDNVQPISDFALSSLRASDNLRQAFVGEDYREWL